MRDHLCFLDDHCLGIQATLAAGAAVKDGEPPLTMKKKEIERLIYGATQFTHGLEEKGMLSGLTRDMCAAIHAYTMPSKFYKILNAILREVERDILKPFFPYLRLA